MTPKMENDVVTPEHFNNCMFKKCLENGLQTSGIDIIDFVTIMGSNPGDNYTSTIYRTKITYRDPHCEKNTISLVIKSIPVNDERTLLEKYGVLEKEINVYTKLLPKLNRILHPTIVAPKCYDIFQKPHLNIVFQDMKAEGYRVADRQIGLDEVHLELVLAKIAKFHAASMQLLKQEPELEKDYLKGIFTAEFINDPVCDSLFKDNIKVGAEMLYKMPGYERFYGKLMKIYDNFEKIALEVVAPDPSEIKVLNHGDLWVNNFLFKYNEKTAKPVDIVFVDYQVSIFNSLAIDLNYLFATSAQLDVLERKLELIETYYYPSFVGELKRLGFKTVPSFRDVVNQIQKREMYNLICMFGVLPTVSMDKEESKTNDFKQFVDQEKAAKKRLVGMSSVRFVESMKYTVEYLESVIDDVISEL